MTSRPSFRHNTFPPDQMSPTERRGELCTLLARGLIPAGWLGGIKSRLLLALLLRAGANDKEIRQAFESWRNPFEQ